MTRQISQNLWSAYALHLALGHSVASSYAQIIILIQAICSLDYGTFLYFLVGLL